MPRSRCRSSLRRGPVATPTQIDDLILWITIGVIVGGRLGHLVFYTPELFAETARLIPGSTLHVLPGRGHITVMRDRRFRQALTAFVAPS